MARPAHQHRAPLLECLGGVLVVLLVLVLLVLLFLEVTIAWQCEANRRVEMPSPGWWYPVGSALVVFAFVILFWRGLAALTRFFLTKPSSRIVREATARLVASPLTVLTVVLAVDQLVQPSVLAIVGGNADRVNGQMPKDGQAPTSSLRSGGPGSSQSWKSLGQDGASSLPPAQTPPRSSR